MCLSKGVLIILDEAGLARNELSRCLLRCSDSSLADRPFLDKVGPATPFTRILAHGMYVDQCRVLLIRLASNFPELIGKYTNLLVSDALRDLVRLRSLRCSR